MTRYKIRIKRTKTVVCKQQVVIDIEAESDEQAHAMAVQRFDMVYALSGDGAIAWEDIDVRDKKISDYYIESVEPIDESAAE